MKRLIIFALLIPAMNLMGQKDPAAEKFLNKVAKDLDPGEAISISFDYEREDQQAGTTIDGSGSLVLMGEKYKIDLGEAIIWFNGEKQYSLQTEIEEVYVSTPDPDNKEFMFTDPIRLLRNYQQEFKYRLIGEKDFHGKSATEIQLYPEVLGGPFALLKLYFSRDNGNLFAIVIRHKEGILYTMILDEMEQVASPGEDFFRFSQEEYPNVDVIELLN